jgi:hypothetical protein
MDWEEFMRTIMIACAFMFGFVSLGSVSAGDNKVDICHFQEESNSWKLISVSQIAAAKLLENHDDAIPGGTTAQTGTVLDAGCEVIEITCPCEGKELLGEVWDTEHWDTFTSAFGTEFFVGIFAPCSEESVQLLEGDCTEAALIAEDTPEGSVCEIFIEAESDLCCPTLSIPTSPAEHAACLESLRQICGADCPF